MFLKATCSLLSRFGPGFPHGNSHPSKNLDDCSGGQVNFHFSSGHSLSVQQQAHLFCVSGHSNSEVQYKD